MLSFTILSLFPSYFESPLKVSILKRGVEKGLLSFGLVDIRKFATGKHQQVDDRPYGGGPGMVMMAEPIVAAIREARRENSHVIYLSPQGRVLTTEDCKRLARKKHLILLCGHYEGVDERAIALEVDEEISIGNYIVTSGAPAALVLVDAISRHVPGVIGNEESIKEDSIEKGTLSPPVFTRPEVVEGIEVPPVLLSGHHSHIEKWRKEKALEKTERVRPDLT
jgi:tRNA (guanine37-N1)-methyltransferase